MSQTAQSLDSKVWPHSATRDSNGVITVGGIPLTDLAEQFGTPLFIYDERHLHLRCQEAVNAFDEGVAFASKSFLSKAMASLAALCSIKFLRILIELYWMSIVFVLSLFE